MVAFMEENGNEKVNAFYEELLTPGFLELTEGLKPGASASAAARERFITTKYVEREFCNDPQEVEKVSLCRLRLVTGLLFRPLETPPSPAHGN